MPEDNFEQQARKLTEAFSVEPQPVVWQRVKVAIAPPKRRRRALLWWWLLPLCMAGGAAIWLLKNKVSAAADKAAWVYKENKINDSVSSEKNITGKTGKKALQNEQNKNSVSPVRASAWQEKKGNVEIKNVPVSEQEKNNNQQPLAAKENEKKNDATIINNSLNNSLPVNRKEESNDVFSPSSSSANTLQDSKQNKLDSSYIFSQDGDNKTNDTATAKAMTASVSTDSVLHSKDTTAVVKIKKKAARRPCSIGVLAEVGNASLGSPLSGSQEKNAQALSSAAPGSLFDLTSGTITQYKITNGIHLALGLSVQKKLSKRIYFTGQATYRYQQFGVSQTVFIDTTAGGSNSGSGGNSLPGVGRGLYRDMNAVQRLHFANAYVGIGWQFVTRKHLALSLQAGIDNAFLLSITQKQNGSADSVKSLPTRNFYRWQPSLQIALPFDSYLGKKIHFELSPFVRFGLSAFQKNSASYQDNHLSSAGIQAIYFFK